MFVLGSTEAALMVNFTLSSHQPEKCAMRTAWVQWRASRATVYPGRCHGTFCGPARNWREISYESSLSRPQKNTTHARDFTSLRTLCIFEKLSSTSLRRFRWPYVFSIVNADVDKYHRHLYTLLVLVELVRGLYFNA